MHGLADDALYVAMRVVLWGSAPAESFGGVVSAGRAKRSRSAQPAAAALERNLFPGGGRSFVVHHLRRRLAAVSARSVGASAMTRWGGLIGLARGPRRPCPRRGTPAGPWYAVGQAIAQQSSSESSSRCTGTLAPSPVICCWSARRVRLKMFVACPGAERRGAATALVGTRTGTEYALGSLTRFLRLPAAGHVTEVPSGSATTLAAVPAAPCRSPLPDSNRRPLPYRRGAAACCRLCRKRWNSPSRRRVPSRCDPVSVERFLAASTGVVDRRPWRQCRITRSACPLDRGVRSPMAVGLVAGHPAERQAPARPVSGTPQHRPSSQRAARSADHGVPGRQTPRQRRRARCPVPCSPGAHRRAPLGA